MTTEVYAVIVLTAAGVAGFLVGGVRGIFADVVGRFGMLLVIDEIVAALPPIFGN